MENLLKWLPAKPQPILLRYGATTLLVAACFLVLRFVEQTTEVSCFFLMYPAVFLAAVLFDRGTGVYAALLSAGLLLASVYYGTPGAVPSHYWLPLALFLIVGLILAVVSEALRQGWERTAKAEHTKDLLYRELSHRTKNDLAMAASVLTMQARSQSNPEVATELETAVGRLHALARTHEQLQPAEGEGVHMPDYLQALCKQLAASMTQSKNVVLQVDCESVQLPIDQANPVGLIVNELVTNACKHAFADGRTGTVTVALQRGEQMMLLVQDDGCGCPENAVSRLSSHLVHQLVLQLDGTMERTPAHPGCRVSVYFPEESPSG